MSATVFGDVLEWSGKMDASLYRTYTLRWRVKTDRVTEGPATVLQVNPGYLPGDWWIFPDDVDVYAWFTGERSVSKHPQIREGARFQDWVVEDTFSNKPPDRQHQRCNDRKVEDPLLEPPRVSGSFTMHQEEGVKDRFGRWYKNSAHEQLRGAQVEWDSPRLELNWEFNVGSFDYVAYALQFLNCLNEDLLWGLPPRTIKLDNVGFDEQYHGLCYKFWKIKLKYGIRYDGFDRWIADEGTKVLYGHWGTALATTGTGIFSQTLWQLNLINGQLPDKDNPQHFVRFKDFEGNPTKVMLNGYGEPATNIGTEVMSIAFISPTTGHPLGQFEVRTVADINLHAGDKVSLAGVDPPWYDGDYTVQSAPAADKFVAAMPINPSGSLGKGSAVWKKGGVVYVKNAGPGMIRAEHYRDADFTLLGLPAVIG